MKPEIIITEDGSHTLYVRELDEHYHSIFGAVTESRHVFINAGLRAANGNHLEILEMGFGTGLNALLTLAEISESGQTVSYIGIEKYPLEDEILSSLNYTRFVSGIGEDLLQKIQGSPWNRKTSITEHFILNKIRGDIFDLDLYNRFELVYFDAFSPDKQPELWTSEIFSRIYHSMKHGSILTTYSSKGTIRQNLSEAGFRTEKLPGPPGKREMTRAIKE